MADALAPPQQSETPAPSLQKLCAMFDDYRTLAVESRKQSETDRDYYDSAFADASQLDDNTRAILKERRQPAIIVNRVKVAVNGVLGVAVQGKTDPRVLMRNPPKQKPPQPASAMMGGAAPGPMQMQAQPEPELDAADVATMTLRYIADVNHFAALKIDVLENMAIEGCGAVIIEGEQDQDVTITRIGWDEFFYDPRSRRHDFSDARYKGLAKWMYADDVAKIQGVDSAALENAFGAGDVSGGADASWMDKPQDSQTKPAWSDSKTRRLMVVEMYYQEGGIWYRCMFHAGGIILTEKSRYVDDKNRTLCAIEAQSAFVDRKNRRYGLVRDMRGPQDELNMRRIKAVHEINTRQVQLRDANAPPVDADIVRAEAARPDGVLPPGWEIVPRNDVVANNLNLMQEAKQEIERQGPVPAILARGNPDASGRAKQLDQQAGLTELARFLGRFTDWEQRVYRQAWARARQFWTAPKWVRVTDDEGAPQYVMINEPDATPDPMTGQPAVDPQTGQPAVKNHIAQMDVDIIVDTVPNTATLQQEIFNEIMQLAQAYVGTPEQIPFKVLIKLSPLPKKREILDEIESAQADAAQAAAPQQQMAQQDAQAKIAKTQSETEKNTAQAKAIEIGAVRDAMQGHAEALNPHVMVPPSQPPIPQGSVPQ